MTDKAPRYGDQAAFDALAPWVYQWLGVESGARVVRTRSDVLEEAETVLGPLAGLDVLELGPHEGEMTACLEGFHPRSVTAVEARTHNFLKCLVVKNYLGLSARFVLADFLPFLEDNTRTWDVILASGVHYHMADPLKLLWLMAKRSQSLILDTIVWDRESLRRAAETGQSPWRLTDLEIEGSCEGFSCRYFRHTYDTSDFERDWRGVVPHAHFMLAEDVASALTFYGFEIVQDIRREKPNGLHQLIFARSR